MDDDQAQLTKAKPRGGMSKAPVPHPIPSKVRRSETTLLGSEAPLSLLMHDPHALHSSAVQCTAVHCRLALVGAVRRPAPPAEYVAY